jgi:hypothetical protein
MWGILIPIGLVVLWIVVMKFVFPRFGVPT